MITITIPTYYKDSFSTIVIDRVPYILRFSYNTIWKYWSMGIYDINKNPLCAGMKLVPNYPINHYNKGAWLPTGVFSLVSFVEGDSYTTEDLKNGSAYLVYIPYDELPENIKIYEE